MRRTSVEDSRDSANLLPPSNLYLWCRIRQHLKAEIYNLGFIPVLQPHIEGDLVKFYGIGPARRRGEPAWFRWFHHADQRLAGHPVDTEALARLAARAAGAIGLEVYGGDAIVGAGGALTLLDLNAWPSFARYRDEAAEVIAAHVALRVGRGR